MIEPQYKLAGFQIVGNAEDKATAIITIIVNGNEHTFNRPLNWSSNHDITFMQQLDKYIRNTVFVHDSSPTNLESTD